MREEERNNEFMEQAKTTPVPIQTKTLLNVDKDTLIEYAKNIVASIQDGHEDALEVLICVKKGLMFFEALDENVRPIVYSKDITSGSNILSVHNADIEASQLGVKWHYEGCNDVILNKLYEELESLKLKIKDRENYLKVITTISEQIDEETGETWKVNPPIKKSTSGYKITIK